MKEILTHNWILKLIALILAISTWAYVNFEIRNSPFSVQSEQNGRPSQSTSK